MWCSLMYLEEGLCSKPPSICCRGASSWIEYCGIALLDESMTCESTPFCSVVQVKIVSFLALRKLSGLKTDAFLISPLLQIKATAIAVIIFVAHLKIYLNKSKYVYSFKLTGPPQSLLTLLTSTLIYSTFKWLPHGNLRSSIQKICHRCLVEKLVLFVMECSISSSLWAWIVLKQYLLVTPYSKLKRMLLWNSKITSECKN